MKWDFFYDENEDKTYVSLTQWEQKTRHLQYTMIIILILVFIALLFLDIVPLS